MGIFDFLFGPKDKPKASSKESYDEPILLNMIHNYELIENKISIDDKYCGHNIVFTTCNSNYKCARDYFLERFDNNYIQFINNRDYVIGIYIFYNYYDGGYKGEISINSNTKGPSSPFLPTIEQAIGLFQKGWPQSIKFKCFFCHGEKSFPINIVKVEKLILFMEVPFMKEIIGWRVAEIKSFVGTGSPVISAEGWGSNKQYLWQNIPDKKITCCMNCSNKLKELKRTQELLNSLIF